MSDKIEPVDSVAAITVGGTDISKNVVTNVLAKNNEFAIYEIETNDINNRLKVFIDGHTNESEQAIQKRFNSVKQKYIEAKGMLAKSSNFEMMKHRIAHTLATCLSDDDVDGDSKFKELIETITKEHEELVANRSIYLAPVFLAISILFILCLLKLDQRVELTPTWQVLTSLLGAALGGGISILNSAKTLNFEEFKTKYHYFLLGTERVLLSFVAAGVAFIAIKSKFIMPTFIESGYWPIMLVMVVSGFSETFVPGFLSKSEKALHNKALQRTSR